MNKTAVIDTQEGITYIQLTCAIQAMDIHVKTGGKMRLTRGPMSNPGNIARLFNLKNEKGRYLRTASSILTKLQEMKKEHDEKMAEKTVNATVLTTVSPGTLN